MTTTPTHSTDPGDPALAAGPLARPTWDEVRRRIAKRSFCVLGTSSPAQRPHVAGVLYAEADDALYVSIERESRKGRNIAANPHVAVTVPIRRLPIGPPATVMFTSTAELLANDDPHVVALARAGRIDAITGHDELDLPGGCIVRIAPPSVVHTYGLGLSLRALLREPLRGGGRVERPSPSGRGGDGR